MITTAHKKPIYNCTSCNDSLNESSHIMEDKKHYCEKCFKLYDTQILAPMITVFAYILFIGSLYGMKMSWPIKSYSYEITFVNYIPALTIGFSGIMTFLLLLATGKGLSYLREIAKNSIKRID